MNDVLTQYFEKPGSLAFFAGVPALLLLLILHFYYRYPKVKRLLGNRIYNEHVYTSSALPRRYFLSHFFFLIFICCALASLAAPRSGKRLVREFHRGADIALAYDISRSMEIRDCEEEGRPQSRLERAAALGRSLAHHETRGDEAGRFVIPADIHIRFALALGKGSAVLAVPLTSDTEAVLSLLDTLSPAAISSRGTNLEALVDAAAQSFNDNFSTVKIVILFSDGEALSGSLAAACERARAQDIILYAVGLGSVEGAPLDAGTPQEQTSALRSEALAAAARITNGEYLDGNAPGVAEELRNIRALAGGSSWNFREEFVPVWHLFLLAALAALLLSKLCVKRFRWPPASG